MAAPFKKIKINCDLITTPFIQVSNDWNVFKSGCSEPSGSPILTISTSSSNCGLEDINIRVGSRRPNERDPQLVPWGNILDKIDFSDDNVIKALNSSLNNLADYSNDLITNPESKITDISGFGRDFTISYIDRFGKKASATVPINDPNILAIVSKVLIEEQLSDAIRRLKITDPENYKPQNREKIKKFAECLGVSINDPTAAERKDLGKIGGLGVDLSDDNRNNAVIMKRIKNKLQENAKNGTFDGNVFKVSVNFACSRVTGNNVGAYDNTIIVSPIPWTDRHKWLQQSDINKDSFD